LSEAGKWLAIVDRVVACGRPILASAFSGRSRLAKGDEAPGASNAANRPQGPWAAGRLASVYRTGSTALRTAALHFHDSSVSACSAIIRTASRLGTR
jgi:hypothetical protein